MASFRLNRHVSDMRSNDGEPNLALVRARESDSADAPMPDACDDDPFRTGIRALYGQLCCCESPIGGPVRSLGVTSCCHHEGKTTVAAHLAAVAAESRQVLFIDANASRSLVHVAMQNVARQDVNQRSGPIGASEAIQRPPIVPTNVLPARKTGMHPTVDETRGLMETLATDFELLIVDLPPLDVATAIEWAPLLDGIVLVVESERVRSQVAARGITLLERAGGNVLGIVINKRRDYIPKWIYRRL